MLKTPSGELPNGVMAGKRMRVIFEFALITEIPYRQSPSFFSKTNFTKHSAAFPSCFYTLYASAGTHCYSSRLKQGSRCPHMN